MYVIIVYDVSTKRVTKVCNLLRQYLTWIQNSVFEGELTESQFLDVKTKLKKAIKQTEDSIIIFTNRYKLEKSVIGVELNKNLNIL